MRPPEFWSRDDPAARVLTALLQPAAWLYGASVQWKRARARPFRPRAKVVCVGNLTVGGTGKTPVAMVIGERLKARGARVAFLTRGYGGCVAGPHVVSENDAARDVGDEALLLMKVAPVIVAHDRAAGARLADCGAFDVLVMDDGLQNFAIEKDLSVVMVDSESGFGNGRVLPAGPLREPVAQGLSRADAVIAVGEKTLRALPFSGAIMTARLEADAGSLEGKHVVAFAGIGRPEKFFTSLRASGVYIAASRAFDDHHPYTDGELETLKQEARQHDAVLVTTEKDLVRLRPEQRTGVVAVGGRVVFADDAQLDALLDRVFPPVLPRPQV